MLDDRIARLLALKLSGEASEDELKELASHFNSSPGDQYFEELLSAYWASQTGQSPEADAAAANDHFQYILQAAGSHGTPLQNASPRHNKGRVIVLRLSVAAVIVFLLSFAAWKFTMTGGPVEPPDQQNEIVAKKGTRSKLVLPDGTTVWLNADSRLVYAGSFPQTKREVHLDGEAYFDVVKDPDRPFIVRTSGIDIRVLGTAFNVKSYKSEPVVEATLIHGMIEVMRKDRPNAPRLILHPHQKLVFDRSADDKMSPDASRDATSSPRDAAISIAKLPAGIPDTSIVETSWVYNKLLFEGETFSDVALKMERWFDVKIAFKNERIADYRLKGSFVNETIEEALQALQLSIPFKYKITDNTVEIDEK